MAEAILQWQGLNLGLILVWQSSANAARLDESQLSWEWNFTFIQRDAQSLGYVHTAALFCSETALVLHANGLGIACPAEAAGWWWPMGQKLNLSVQAA